MSSQQEQDGDISLPHQEQLSDTETQEEQRQQQYKQQGLNQDEDERDGDGDGDGDGDLGGGLHESPVHSNEHEGTSMPTKRHEPESDGDIGVAHHSDGQGEKEDENLQKATHTISLEDVDADSEELRSYERSNGSASDSDSVVDEVQHDRRPPQRYEVEQWPPFTARASGHDSESFETKTSRAAHNPSTSYVGHLGSGESSRQVSETEDAGLDFVDINLGPAAHAGTANGGASPYGAGAHFASRSAVEIRQDSISSNSVKAREIAKVAESMQRSESQEARRRQRNTDAPQQQQRSDSLAFEVEQQDRAVNGEGSGSNVTPTFRPAVHATEGGIMMTFANEDGEMDDVISPVTEIAWDNRRSLQTGAAKAGNDVTADDRQSQEPNEEMHRLSTTADEAQVSPSVSMNGVQAADAGNQDNSSAAPSTPPMPEQVSPSDESAKSPTLTDAADRDRQGKRTSAKPSALEQHLSRTRMTTLPPKPKVEDVKHLQDFETMMKISRQMEQKKRQEDEERKNKRDISLQERIKIWEKDILPSWTRARRETRLRRLWQKGVPPNLRPRVWALACGNSQMLPRNLFSKANAEARQQRQAGTFPVAELDAIEVDIEQTLPTMRLFQKETGALHEDLFEVLCAFTLVRLDQAKSQASQSNGSGAGAGSDTNQNEQASVAVYPMGAASLAAMLLTNLSPSETLIALINLIAERPWLRALYSLSATNESRQSLSLYQRSTLSDLHVSHSDNGVDASKSRQSSHLASPLSPSAQVRQSLSATAQRPYNASTALAGFERVFDTLLADQMPKVYANMQARGVRPSAYVNRWIRTLFVPYLPFDAVARLWDWILLEESDALLFRTGIALVSLLSARLYVPDKDELVSILHGNNRAAIAVWTRIRTDGVEVVASPTQQRQQQQQSAVNGAAEGLSRSTDDGDGDEENQSTSVDSAVLSATSTTFDESERDAAYDEQRRRRESVIFAPDELVPRDDIYGGQYGITERNVFEALDEQETWWKDSVLERLLDREIVS